MNILEHPLTWFIVTSIAFIMMEGNKKRTASIREEFSKLDKRTGDGLEYVVIDVTAILAWILMLLGMIMTIVTVGPSTTPFEVLTMGALAVILGIYVAVKQIAKNRLTRSATIFWVLRSTEAMSIVTAFGFWSAIFSRPETRSLLGSALCLGSNIIASSVMIIIMAGIYLLMSVAGVTINPSKEIFKVHLKWLPILNPFTSFIAIPLFGLYWIFRKFFRFIISRRKAKL